MINLYHQAGYSGLFILLLSLLAVFTAIRGIVLMILIKKQESRSDGIVGTVISEATAYRKRSENAGSDTDRGSLETVVNTLMQVQMKGVYSSVYFLKLCAAVGPLAGLLGTVLGMVDVFSTLSSRSMPDPSLLAGGIWEALLTTVMGLTLAIPSVIVHYWLLMNLRSIRNRINLRLCNINTDSIR